MPKYLIEASYTLEGVKGLLKEGGTRRRENLKSTIEGLGGRQEAFYYVFGEDDLVIILDLPDNVTAAAASLRIAAAGGATSRVRVLITPEEIDQASKQEVQYRGPGS
jgi:uncharacterized protein with GYD domain